MALRAFPVSQHATDQIPLANLTAGESPTAVIHTYLYLLSPLRNRFAPPPHYAPTGLQPNNSTGTPRHLYLAANLLASRQKSMRKIYFPPPTQCWKKPLALVSTLLYPSSSKFSARVVSVVRPRASDRKHCLVQRDISPAAPPPPILCWCNKPTNA